jgi:hypothetical protein
MFIIRLNFATFEEENYSRIINQHLVLTSISYFRIKQRSKESSSLYLCENSHEKGSLSYLCNLSLKS